MAVLPEDERLWRQLQAEMEGLEGEKTQKGREKYERQVKENGRKALEQIICSARMNYDQVFVEAPLTFLQKHYHIYPGKLIWLILC